MALLQDRIRSCVCSEGVVVMAIISENTAKVRWTWLSKTHSLPGQWLIGVPAQEGRTHILKLGFNVHYFQTFFSHLLQISVSIIVYGSFFHMYIVAVFEGLASLLSRWRLMDSKPYNRVWSGAHTSLKGLRFGNRHGSWMHSKLFSLEASHLGSSSLKASVVLVHSYLRVLLDTMSWSLHIPSCAWHETGCTSTDRSQYVSKVKLICSFYFLVIVRDGSQIYPIRTIGLNSRAIEWGSRFFFSFVLWEARTSGWSLGPESRANWGEIESRNQYGDIIWTRNKALIQTILSTNNAIFGCISHTLPESFWLKLSVPCK